jgi:hypothetical protein
MKDTEMSSYADQMVQKIEALPISVANRSIAKANFIASEATVERFANTLAWFRSFGLKSIMAKRVSY